nr:hypothetical protein [Tanacetum cinerariifolium]
MEEYIQLMADKARGRDHTFNWETATYNKEYCDDLDSFTDFETNFPATIYNDAPASTRNVSFRPTKMDDPNITMEEYIQLMADKARGRDHTFNWETATYNKEYCDDLDSFTDFETNFLATIYNDAPASTRNVSFRPTDEDYDFIYNEDSSSYKLIPVNDLKSESVNDYVEIKYRIVFGEH